MILIQMDSMTGIDFFQTQFIRSQGLLFEVAISYILLSKNFFFVVWMAALNSFQCWRSPDAWYLLRLVVQSWFHHYFECFVMCFSFAWLFQDLSKVSAICWTTPSNSSLNMIVDELMLEKLLMSDSMNLSFSSLSLLIDLKLRSVLVSAMPTSIVSGTWSKSLRISGWSLCWLNPLLLGGRKTRSITELEFCVLSAYLVGPGFRGGESSRPRLSVMVRRSLVWVEWCQKLGSQSLSLMLKLPVMIIIPSRLMIFCHR